ncbi:MAG TPA: GAF domain-containing protein, partial [Solirubrobacterales bacterium]|nr:GAF domain-containing protein [Solirubrobacterales bacterium]
MTGEHPFAWKKADLFWVAVSLVILWPCLYYPYAATQGKLSFSLNPYTGKILAVNEPEGYTPCVDPTRCFQINDQVLAFGSITFEEFRRNHLLTVFDTFDSRGTALFRVLRNGQVLTIPVRRITKKHLQYVPLEWLFPFTFWLMGTIAIIFLRPRDERWYVLVLFSYVTALWIASGLASISRAAGSGIVFHLLIWFFLPLTTHLHLILPNSLLARRGRLLAPLYASSAALAIADFAHLLHGFEYILSFALAVVVSLGLLVARLFLPAPASVKVATRIMLYGVALGFGPILSFWIIVPLFFHPGGSAAQTYSPAYSWTIALLIIALPILVMSYIYAIYKHHLGALEFRANRLLGAYSFISIYITFYVVILFSVSRAWAPMSERALATTLALSLVFLLSALVLRARFQALVDRNIFGIRHSPEEVIDIVSERIPKAFNRSILAQVIVGEILPSLLIRQSALYLFDESRIETLYEQALPPDEPAPAPAELAGLFADSRRYLPPPAAGGPRSWVRLIVPLSLQAETIGIWLIGRRDPDDFYPASDIHLLSTVANQIAPMVENIRLYERAQQEIAYRKAAEEEIRRSEERFRTLFEATLEG